MATLTLTAANVGLDGSNIGIKQIQTSAAMTQGTIFYVDDNDQAAAADVDTAAKATVEGMILTPTTAADKWALYLPLRDAQSQGKQFVPGGTMVANTLYYLTGTGIVGVFGDLATNEYITPLFRAETTTVAIVECLATGLQAA